MTCIVGLTHNGKVYLGGDSAGVDSADLSFNIRAQPKVFRNGEFVIGYTTSFRMGNLLQHTLVPPRHHPDDDVHKFMVTEFVDAVKACFESGGFTAGGNFLAGFAGRLFEVQEDWQVAETVDGFMACGCGEKYAMGSLATSKGRPRDRVLKALTAAERFSAVVRAPFHIEVA